MIATVHVCVSLPLFYSAFPTMIHARRGLKDVGMVYAMKLKKGKVTEWTAATLRTGTRHIGSGYAAKKHATRLNFSLDCLFIPCPPLLQRARSMLIVLDLFA